MTTSHKANILLVDDNLIDTKIFRFASRELSWVGDIRETANGLEALELLNESLRGGWQPDLIMLDLNMPQMNGFELLQAMGQSPNLPSIPVLVLTSSSAPADLIEACRHQARGFLVKPTDSSGFSQMLATVEEFWNNSCAPAKGTTFEVNERVHLKDLGGQVVALRVNRGLSREELAKLLNVTTETVARDERQAYSGANISTIHEVLKVLGYQAQVRLKNLD